MALAMRASLPDATPLSVVACVADIVDPPASMAPPSADALRILRCYIDGRDHPLRRPDQARVTPGLYVRGCSGRPAAPLAWVLSRSGGRKGPPAGTASGKLT